MSAYDFARLTIAVSFALGCVFMTAGFLEGKTHPDLAGLKIAGMWLIAVPAVLALVVLMPR